MFMSLYAKVPGKVIFVFCSMRCIALNRIHCLVRSLQFTEGATYHSGCSMVCDFHCSGVPFVVIFCDYSQWYCRWNHETTWQEFRSRPTTGISAEAGRYRYRAVPYGTIQPVTGCWAVFASVQGGVRHSSHQKTSLTLVAAEVSSYRPVSNLPVISNSLSDSSPSNLLTICSLPICCRHSSLISDLATPQKPTPCGCFPTPLRPSTVVMLQHWSFWTCRLHLTLSTMSYCVDVWCLTPRYPVLELF